MSESRLGIFEYDTISRPSERRAILNRHTLRFASPLLHVAYVSLALVLLFALPAFGQGTMSPGPRSYPGQAGHSTSSADLSVSEQDYLRNRKMVAALNAQRQRNMISEADKLLRLAVELNVELAREESGLSPSQQMHKVAEIEKLARNVKEKMVYSMSSSPDPENSVVLKLP